MVRSWVLLFGLAVMFVGNPCSVLFAAGDDWHVISLPYRAADIVEVGDTLWICGTNEMTARSQDGGATWQIKHEKANGEVLLRIGFLGDRTGYAAGSNGLVMWTRDGGDSWNTIHSDPTAILDISFGDERHGIRRTRSGVQLTSDAGATWTPINKIDTNEDLAKFPLVSSIATLGSEKAAILLKEGQYGDQIFLTTTDSRKTWKTTYIPSVVIRNLVVHDGEYWAFGIEVIEKDKPGGGHSVPLALHSPDGVTWTHGIRAPHEFEDCNSQGCVLWDGAIVELYHQQPVFWSLPADGSLTAIWASAKGAICSLGPALKCAHVSVVAAPPPRPEFRGLVAQAVNNPVWPSGCLICRVDQFSAPRNLNINNVFDVNFTVRKDGTIRDVTVSGAPPAVQEALSHAVAM
ncbi:MAG: YCF48-related protein, partial [Candidatus Acidiferrales bacterium]